MVTLTVDTDGDQGDETSQITSTDEHPYWLSAAGRWSEAEHLKPGVWLRISSGTWVQVTAVDHTHATKRVHNLTVADTHTYYVTAGQTSVLVHDCGPGGQADAELARQRADELQVQRNDYPFADQNGTTAVVGVRNSRAGDLSLRVGINGSGSAPSAWSLRNGEEFVQAPGRAEEGIIDGLGLDEFVDFGGISRNICASGCRRLLNPRGIRFGGNFHVGQVRLR